MVVVTTPMGVHTPPAFAATTTIAPKRRRSSSIGIIFRNRLIMTIVTVKLFRMLLKTRGWAVVIFDIAINSTDRWEP
jgi:hypothetical protein